jgi:hypothetical protein
MCETSASASVAGAHGFMDAQGLLIIFSHVVTSDGLLLGLVVLSYLVPSTLAVGRRSSINTLLCWTDMSQPQ